MKLGILTLHVILALGGTGRVASGWVPPPTPSTTPALPPTSHAARSGAPVGRGGGAGGSAGDAWNAGRIRARCSAASTRTRTALRAASGDINGSSAPSSSSADLPRTGRFQSGAYDRPIVLLGTSDALVPVPTAELFQERVRAVGSRSELRLDPRQPHGFFNGPAFRDGASQLLYDLTYADTLEFLLQIVSP